MNIRRNLFIFLSLAVLAVSCSREKTVNSPNIVFILIDDMGWKDTGCYGSEFYETPNIDQLAAEGMKFTDAYAACPVCSPTRASILTGAYPARLGVTDYIYGRRNLPEQPLLMPPNGTHLPFSNITLAEALKEKGYLTAMIGKWHLGDTASYPEKHGFDINVAGYHRGYPPSYFYPYEREGKSNPEIPTLQGGKPGEYLTDRLTDEAINFIDTSDNRPFFLYLSHYAVHDPVQAKEEKTRKYMEKLAQMNSPDRLPYILEGNPARPGGPFSREYLDSLIQTDEFDGFGYFPERLTKIKQIQDNPVFAGMVESVDESVGRIITKLDEMGLTENTIVIFFADNGGMSSPDDQSTANSPLRGAKGWLYEGGIREPLIVKWPHRIMAGTVSDYPVISTDFFPTLLDLAGLPLLQDGHPDGISIAQLLLRNEAPGERALFWHWPHYSNHGQQSPASVIRKGKYKLIEYHENGYLQLFDLVDDIGEQVNLSESMPGTRNELLKELHEWRAEVGAKMPVPNPDWSPSPDNKFPRW